MPRSLRSSALALLALIMLPLAASALPITETVTTAGRETGVIVTIGESTYAAGGELTITRAVTDDLFAAAGRVTVGSQVGGDLVVAGGEVTINGSIADDVRAAGGRVTVNGTIGGHLVVTGGEVVITDGAVIDGEVVASGGRVTFAGETGGDLALMGGDLALSGTAAGQAEIQAQNLTVADTAQIGGMLTYRTPEQLTLPEGVAGAVQYEPLRQRELGFGIGEIYGAYAGAVFFGALLTAITGAVLIALSRRQVAGLAITARAQPGIAILVGLAFFVMPLVVLLLALSVVGIWLAVLVLLVWLLILFVAKILAGFVIGQFILRVQGPSSYWRLLGAFLIGLVILTLIGLIPLVGWVLQFLALVFSIGVVTVSRVHLYNRLKHDKLV